MDTRTQITGLATTLFHSECVPHYEEMDRLYQVLNMSESTAYEQRNLRNLSAVKFFTQEATQTVSDALFRSDSITLREFGDRANHIDFDRRVYGVGLAAIDSLNLREFTRQSITIRSVVTPLNPDEANHFAWDVISLNRQDLSRTFQRSVVPLSQKLCLPRDKESTDEIIVNLSADARKPRELILDCTVNFPNRSLGRTTMGRATMQLTHAEKMLNEKVIPALIKPVDQKTHSFSAASGKPFSMRTPVTSDFPSRETVGAN